MSWEWPDDEQADLYVETAPYALIDQRRRAPLTERDWQEILEWLRDKALGLVRLARLELQVVGVGCPAGKTRLFLARRNGLLLHVMLALG